MGINRTKLATKLPAVMVAVVATSALHAVLQLPGVAMIAPLPAIFPSVNMPDFPSLSESAHIAAASVLFVSPLLIFLANLQTFTSLRLSAYLFLITFPQSQSLAWARWRACFRVVLLISWPNHGVHLTPTRSSSARELPIWPVVCWAACQPQVSLPDPPYQYLQAARLEGSPWPCLAGC